MTPFKLFVTDLDSTLIQGEGIDELARENDKFDEVAAITRDAMNGKISFDESLRRRCEKLQGLDLSAFERAHERLTLMNGAKELMNAVRAHGLTSAIISGGFGYFAREAQKTLGFDYAFANELEIQDGRLTGQVVPPIINGAKKAEIVRSLMQKLGLTADQVIAIGDGSNDLLMLQTAGTGIAFCPKPFLAEKIKLQVNVSDLGEVIKILWPAG
ncbi:phosphoserine phosphatase SerB [Bdellovibrionota bacterium FG-2]